MSRLSLAFRVFLFTAILASACSSEPTDVVADPEPTPTLAPADDETPVSPSPRATPNSNETPPVDPTVVQAPPPTVVSPPPTTAETSVPVDPHPDCGPDGPQYRFEVVNVAPNDPDGGLITHTGPGASTPEIGLLPWDAGNILYYDCAFALNGVAWWQVGAGTERAWVNSNYLGDRRVAGDALAASPCSRDESTVFPIGAGVPDGGSVVVADIDVESSAECDRVVIEMGQGFDGFDSIVTSLTPEFGAEFIDTITRTDSEIQIKLAQVEPFAFGVAVESWRDMNTDEQNVALLMEDYDLGSTVYVGWGTGQAYLRFAQEPTPRLIIDIFQEPTPANSVVGPIVGSAVLFDPIQTDLTGPGVTLPITLRGWSRGFESSSVLKLTTWDQSDSSSPLNWQGELFGADAANLFTSGVEFAVPLEDFGVPYWPFMTTGYFEITITDMTAGAYQFAVEPSSGCFTNGGTGQQFRVIADDEPSSVENPPAVPFTLERRWVGDDFEQSQTVMSVLGVEALGPIEDSPC